MATPTPTKYQTSKGETRYEVRYRPPGARSDTRKRGFKTKREAVTWANSHIVQVSQGQYVAPSLGRATVAEVYRTWLPRQVHAKPSWAARQESLWRVHVEPKWGNHQVSKVAKPDVADWITSLDRAPSTVADAHGLLASILDEAVDERRIAANPARGVRLPRRELKEHVYLTHAQVRTLADEVSRYGEVVLLLAYSGIRWGEMAALRPKDVDLARGRIRIGRSASKVNQSSRIVAPKTWEARSVAAPGPVLDALRPVLDAQRDPEGLLWARADGSPIMPPTSTHWFTAGVKRCVENSIPRDEDGEPTGVPTFPRVSAHQLRHTAASLMIQSGAHVKTVQRQLGHKSAVMTLDNYGHLMPDDLDGIAERMTVGFHAAREADGGQNEAKTAS